MSCMLAQAIGADSECSRAKMGNCPKRELAEPYLCLDDNYSVSGGPKEHEVLQGGSVSLEVSDVRSLRPFRCVKYYTAR